MMMTEQERNFRNDYSVVIELPVQWGDMDAFNHVNNVIYLRWFESARIVYLQQVGVTAQLQDSALGPVLASSAVRYRVPIEFPDQVLIGVAAQSFDGGNLVQRYGVFSRQKQVLTTTGEARLVMYDFQQQSKAQIADDILAKIAALEASRGAAANC